MLTWKFTHTMLLNCNGVSKKCDLWSLKMRQIVHELQTLDTRGIRRYPLLRNCEAINLMISFIRLLYCSNTSFQQESIKMIDGVPKFSRTKVCGYASLSCNFPISVALCSYRNRKMFFFKLNCYFWGPSNKALSVPSRVYREVQVRTGSLLQSRVAGELEYKQKC